MNRIIRYDRLNSSRGYRNLNCEKGDNDITAVLKSKLRDAKLVAIGAEAAAELGYTANELKNYTVVVCTNCKDKADFFFQYMKYQDGYKIYMPGMADPNTSWVMDDIDWDAVASDLGSEWEFYRAEDSRTIVGFTKD